MDSNIAKKSAYVGRDHRDMWIPMKGERSRYSYLEGLTPLTINFVEKGIVSSFGPNFVRASRSMGTIEIVRLPGVLIQNNLRYG